MLQPGETSVSHEEHAVASAPRPETGTVAVVRQLCFQCKKHKQSLSITLAFAVTLGKPVYPHTGFESVLQVAWGCGFLLFLVSMHMGVA